MAQRPDDRSSAQSGHGRRDRGRPGADRRDVAAALPSAKAGALSDSSTCSAWSSATSAQQTAYAHLYITEHASSVGGGLGTANVASTINGDCNHAAYLGEADDVSIVAALNHAF